MPLNREALAQLLRNRQPGGGGAAMDGDPTTSAPPGQSPLNGNTGSMTGMVPEALQSLWGMIPSAADMAVTGKLAATPQEYDQARAMKEAEIGAASASPLGAGPAGPAAAQLGQAAAAGGLQGAPMPQPPPGMPPLTPSASPIADKGMPTGLGMPPGTPPGSVPQNGLSGAAPPNIPQNAPGGISPEMSPDDMPDWMLPPEARPGRAPARPPDGGFDMATKLKIIENDMERRQKSAGVPGAPKSERYYRPRGSQVI